MSYVELKLLFSRQFLPRLEVLFDGGYHLVAHFGRLREPRSKVALDGLELLPVAIHVTEADTVTPVLHERLESYECMIMMSYSRGKRELQVICSKRVVFDGSIDYLVE